MVLPLVQCFGSGDYQWNDLERQALSFLWKQCCWLGPLGPRESVGMITGDPVPRFARFHAHRRHTLHGFHAVGSDSRTGCAAGYFLFVCLICFREGSSEVPLSVPSRLVCSQLRLHVGSTREGRGVRLFPVLGFGQL